jgi:hypothetical protein
MTMENVADHLPFCANPDCVLHVRVGDAGVVGSGNWAQFADGRIIGRIVYCGVYLCDVCGRSLRPVEFVQFAEQ